MATKIKSGNFDRSATTFVVQQVSAAVADPTNSTLRPTMESIIDSAFSNVVGGTGITYTHATKTFDLTNTGVSAGTYGDSSTIPSLTINAQGQITAVSGKTVYIPPAYDNTNFDSDFGTKSTTDLTEGSNLYYTKARVDSDVQQGITALIAGAPTALDTLNELAAALNDDANFAATITNQIAALPDSSQVSLIISADVDKTFVDALNVNADTLDGQQGTYYLDYTNFTNTPNVLDSAQVSGIITADVDKTFIDNLNVDADTLDSLNSTQFLRSDSSDTMSGSLTITGDLTVDTNTLYVDTTNNRVGIGTGSPGTSLDLSSKTDAIALPSGTTAQRPGSALAGYTRYNSDTGSIEFYDGNNWISTNLIPEVNSVTGTIYAGAESTLTLEITNATETVTVRFSEDGSTVADVGGVTVTSGSASVTVPAAVYGQTAGGTIAVSILNQDGTPSSNSVSKTVQGLPTGGTVSTTGSYRVHTFTSSGTFTVPSGFTADAEYLIVAGGGGGGVLGGGGGAGGLLTNLSGSAVAISAGAYSVVVGAGGNRGSAHGPAGYTGGNSSALGYTALGGGGGGCHDSGTTSVAGTSGGSGGGGSDNNNTYGPGSGTSGQGYSGGNGSPVYTTDPRGGGGGGGAGGVGLNYNSSPQKKGGPGVQNNIDGNNYYYAGGGGGSAYGSSSSHGGDGGIGGGGGGSSNDGSAGVGGGSARNSGTSGGTGNASPGGLGGANTGGGGGASSWEYTSGGASGGSGIVIIRYPI